MTKRILSILLVLCMVIGFVPMSARAEGGFLDVADGAWYADDVAYAAERGLMNGVGDGKFDPSGTTTRAMIVTILHRLEGKPTAEKSGFEDVPAGKWYAAAVDWAAANEIVNGMDAKTFAPDNAITREQFAVILYRYASFKGMDVQKKADLSAYQDAAKVSVWGADAMAWANAAGLINGLSSTELAPQGTATRAQAATILARFDRMVRSADAKPGTVKLTVDKTDATVTEPKQTFTGAFTVENDQIDRIDWVQHCDSDLLDGTTGTAMIDQSKGTWEAVDVLLAPGLNTIVFTAHTKNGAAAEQTVEITYDSGEVSDYSDGDITYVDDLGNGFVNNVILVIVDVSASDAEKEAAISAVCSAVGGEVIGQLNSCGMYQIRVPKGDMEALAALCRLAEAASSLVMSASLDIIYPDSAAPFVTGVDEGGNVVLPDANVLSVPDRDPLYPNDTWGNFAWDNGQDGSASWDINDPQDSNWWAEAIRAPGAWAYDEYLRNTIRVGIADTGITKTHPDLTITRTLSTYNDPKSHGTHVAGLIGATANNNLGVTGVAWNQAEIYNWDLYNGGSSMSDLTKAIGILIQNGCKVMNLSVGRVYRSPSELRIMSSDASTVAGLVNNWATNYGDFLIFQSAGNGYNKPTDDSDTDFSAYSYDAKYNGTFCPVTNSSAKEHIVVVACAMQPKYSEDEAHPNAYHLTQWSCFGDQVTLASPGYHIYSTVYFTTATNDTKLDQYVANSDGYTRMSGTSMASPIAAGCAALTWSVNPSMSSKEIKDILVDTAGVCYRNEKNAQSTSVDGYSVGYDARETYPFVNVEAAVEEALNRTYGDGTLAVSFVNAESNQPVDNVHYEIHLGSADGPVVASGTADGSANIPLPRAQGTDYHQAQYYLVATGNFTTWTSNAFSISVGGTPKMTAALSGFPEAANAYRIVLTWDEKPADLDAHLSAANGGHVYYKNQSIDNARMDLDDTQSYGPETITVTDVAALGGFTFSVHNFSDRAVFDHADGLRKSGATVRVYSGRTLLKTYTVPDNMDGTVWNVFSVDASGQITDGGGFAYSGNGEAIVQLFPVAQTNAQSFAVSSTAAWQQVEPDKTH